MNIIKYNFLDKIERDEKNCDEIYCAPTASKCYGIGKR